MLDHGTERTVLTLTFLQRKSMQHWVKAKIKHVLLCLLQAPFQASKGWQHSGFSSRADNHPYCMTLNMQLHACRWSLSESGQDQRSWESLFTHTTVKEWDNFAKAWFVKPAIDHAFVLHLGKASKILFPFLPKESTFHRASPATHSLVTVSCINHILWLLRTAWTLHTGYFLTSKHAVTGMTNT